jgi:S-adenosylmethionine synthetase
VAVAIVDQYVDSLAEYDAILEDVEQFVTSVAKEYTDKSITVHTNNADSPDKDSIYLTTSGTSAEMGDDGSVGRGNRANGLITPDRPMSMEASSGKNPVNHVGKIYNLLSTEIAEAVVAEVDEIKQLHLRLVSQIGRPIDEPHVASAEVIPEGAVEFDELESEVMAAIDDELADITDLTKRVINGDLSTF